MIFEMGTRMKPGNLRWSTMQYNMRRTEARSMLQASRGLPIDTLGLCFIMGQRVGLSVVAVNWVEFELFRVVGVNYACGGTPHTITMPI